MWVVDYLSLGIGAGPGGSILGGCGACWPPVTSFSSSTRSTVLTRFGFSYGFFFLLRCIFPLYAMSPSLRSSGSSSHKSSRIVFSSVPNSAAMTLAMSASDSLPSSFLQT